MVTIFLIILFQYISYMTDLLACLHFIAFLIISVAISNFVKDLHLCLWQVGDVNALPLERFDDCCVETISIPLDGNLMDTSILPCCLQKSLGLLADPPWRGEELCVGEVRSVLPGPTLCFLQSFRLVQLETGVSILRYLNITILIKTTPTVSGFYKNVSGI